MAFVEIKITCEKAYEEILMAELSMLNFDTFQETDKGFAAYVEEGHYEEEPIKKLIDRYQEQALVEWQSTIIEKRNWNEEWEKNYDPIIVDDKCLVKASFHNIDKQYQYEILIDPKMSFGTGHHETTYLMISHLLTLDLQGKHAMDIGCGTGILAILAEKLGAKTVIGCDIDAWAVENAKENLTLNKSKHIELLATTAASFTSSKKADVLIANINKNVLLKESKIYDSLLKTNGTIVLSGFYDTDLSDLRKCYGAMGYEEVQRKTKNNWCAILLEK